MVQLLSLLLAQQVSSSDKWKQICSQVTAARSIPLKLAEQGGLILTGLGFSGPHCVQIRTGASGYTPKSSTSNWLSPSNDKFSGLSSLNFHGQ